MGKAEINNQNKNGYRIQVIFLPKGVTPKPGLRGHSIKIFACSFSSQLTKHHSNPLNQQI